MRKKRFKETKIGGWLKDKAPEILNTAGDLLPDAGLLGMVGKMIDSSQLSSEDKALAHRQLTELYRLEVEDRKSARKLYSTR